MIKTNWKIPDEMELQWKQFEKKAIEALKPGMKVFPQASTCSRYAHIVGEFVGFKEERGNMMAVVQFPPINEYNEYFEKWKGPWNQNDYNPFYIYRNAITASYYPSMIDVVTDDSIKLGSLVDENVWKNSTNPVNLK